MTAMRAVAYLIGRTLQGDYPLRCGHPLAACGSAVLGRGTAWPDGTTRGLYAGMRPAVLSRPVTLALTEEPGGPADPRQVYDTAYDNPAFTLHVTGDALAWMDRVARAVREELDMATHLETPYGTVNGLRVGPAKRTNRNTRPRYELSLGIQAEYIRNQED